MNIRIIDLVGKVVASGAQICTIETKEDALREESYRIGTFHDQTVSDGCKHLLTDTFNKTKPR